ncbi:hypothetical protein [Vibrio sp. WXL103]|uniref:hypothetical protein n=1 Tax=Vibrio sp. WXL103 TaxID=3450710 RepID=UPI003EC798AF
MKPKVVFVNDTSTFNNHFGCQLVGQTIREQISRVGMEITLTLGLKFKLTDEIHNALSQADLVIINGEGCVHHGRNKHLLDLAKRYKCVLINCVYEKNPEWEELNYFKYVSARESYSAREILKVRAQCDVVPDVIFASSYLNSFLVPKPNLDIGFTDNVTDTSVGFGPKPKLIRDYFVELSKYKRLCIGRFHAVISAIVMEKPFSSWDSNTFKTRAMMEDIGISHLHFSNFEDAKNSVPTEFPREAIIFKQKAKLRVEFMFDRLYQIAIGRL